VRASAGAVTPADGSTASVTVASYSVAAKVTVIPANGAYSAVTEIGSEEPPIAQVAAVVTVTAAVASETQTSRSGRAE